MKLINSTALAALFAASTAFAGSHSSGDMEQSSSVSNEKNAEVEGAAQPVSAASVEGNNTAETSSEKAELIRARDIIGGAIYTMNEASDEGWHGFTYDEVGADWNEIGEIEDVVLSHDGEMVGVVAEIGGFLDIGDKHVMLPIADVNLVPVDEAGYAIVTRFNEEQLEELDNVDESGWY